MLNFCNADRTEGPLLKDNYDHSCARWAIKSRPNNYFSSVALSKIYVKNWRACMKGAGNEICVLWAAHTTVLKD